MKKIIAILLVVLMVITLFAGCSARATTAETENLPVINVGETVPDETEASTEAETTTEKPTETTTGETTTEKVTETTTKADSTTKKSETTSKKSETTTKTETTTGGETTTKKSSSSGSTTTTKPSTTKPAETTTKPAPATTSHTHNWTAHYAEREVLVKDAWDEPDHWVDKYHTHTSGRICKTCGQKFGLTCDVCGYFYAYEQSGYEPYGDDIGKSPTGNNAWEDASIHAAKTGHTLKNTTEVIAWIDLGYWEKGEHHDAEYKTEKYIDYYYCSCGAKKNA